MTTAQIIPFGDETLLEDVATIAQAAKARGMYLISDGNKVVVSPIVPPGFYKIAIKIKDAARAALEPMPCAA